MASRVASQVRPRRSSRTARPSSRQLLHARRLALGRQLDVLATLEEGIDHVSGAIGDLRKTAADRDGVELGEIHKSFIQLPRSFYHPPRRPVEDRLGSPVMADSKASNKTSEQTPSSPSGCARRGAAAARRGSSASTAPAS